MNQKILAFNQTYLKKNPPLVQPGDTVRVHQRIVEGVKERIQIFEGLVIAQKHGVGWPGSFTVRKIGLAGVGVERTFLIHSPSVVKVERIKSTRVRRAKLYYLRDRPRTGLRLKREQAAKVVWEEPEAEKELEKIHQEQEVAAEQKELEKKQEEEELEKKFEAVKGSKVVDGQGGEPTT